MAAVSGPSAHVVADSISPSGDRLTTIEVTFHRFVLAEFNTHRAFSRNSASSRAIPVAKQIERVVYDPAVPVVFPCEQRGMQGGDALEGRDYDDALGAWLDARDAAVRMVKRLVDRGVHKSVANRLLEPFMWHTAIVSATDWDGFWEQRCSPLAQPEIRVAAEAMRAAYDASAPAPVRRGEWHLPYVSDDELVDLGIAVARQVSVARCARVSYLTHDGKRDTDADVALYDKLVSARPGHWSPLEHVATPTSSAAYGPQGNFRGWRQHRHEVEQWS